MLCSLGVFNAPLMNDAIFKFKRYEDASLTYTGIDKHTNDEVGGWDTTIRKTQYERLFYNQQSSMTKVEQSLYTQAIEPTESKHREYKHVQSNTKGRETQQSQPKPLPQPKPDTTTSTATTAQKWQTTDDTEVQLETINIDSIVSHKMFGKGRVVKMNKNEKFIYVRFGLGEKKFIFPDAFLMGFLKFR